MSAPSSAAPRPRLAGGVRALLGRVFALAVAAVVLASTLGAGRTYLFCTMMQEHVERCCCAPVRDEAEPATDDAPAIEAGCCEDHTAGTPALGRLALAGIEVPPGLPAAFEVPLVVATEAPAARFERVRPTTGMPASPIRAGPGSAADTCVRLQVFRC